MFLLIRYFSSDKIKLSLDDGNIKEERECDHLFKISSFRKDMNKNVAFMISTFWKRRFQRIGRDRNKNVNIPDAYSIINQISKLSENFLRRLFYGNYISRLSGTLSRNFSFLSQTKSTAISFTSLSS